MYIPVARVGALPPVDDFHHEASFPPVSMPFPTLSSPVEGTLGTSGSDTKSTVPRMRSAACSTRKHQQRREGGGVILPT